MGIEKVGLYIPGGTAPLFSTVLMLAVDVYKRQEQYTNLASHVNVLIPRYAPNALTENNILGSGRCV